MSSLLLFVQKAARRVPLIHHALLQSGIYVKLIDQRFLNCTCSVFACLQEDLHIAMPIFQFMAEQWIIPPEYRIARDPYVKMRWAWQLQMLHDCRQAMTASFLETGTRNHLPEIEG